MLATDTVRFLGEAVAVVVADSWARALDAAEAVEVDYEPLEVLTDPEAALASDAPRLFGDAGNLAKERPWPEPSRALEGAEVVVKARFVNQRVTAAPLEPNAAVAVPTPEGDGVVLYSPCQAPFWVRDDVAAALGMAPERVRVVVPAVGGAFGARIITYPEQVALAALAMRLGRPVRYVESRSETMLAMTHGRAQVQEVELAATRDGRITGLRARLVADGGAYPGEASPNVSSTRYMASGVYRIARVEVAWQCVATNTTPVAAYRGAGRPEATAMVERAVDLLAARLRLDPAEVRRRNLIPARAFPYTTATKARYDSGDYEGALDRVLEAAGYQALRAEQAGRRQRGEVVQLGIGRPSTYASIISTIQDRGYVRLEDRRFFPNDVGEVVTDKLVEHFPDIVNVNFTAEMEDDLDEIAEGDLQRVQVLRQFYTPFADALERAEEKFERYVEELDEDCPRCIEEGRTPPGRLQKRLGRYGFFIGCTRFAEEDGGCKYIRNLDGQERPEPEMLDENCPDCGRPLQRKFGRFGPFVGCSGYPDCTYIKKDPPKSTGVTCPQCKQGEIVERRTRFGLMYGCERYPDCDFAVNHPPVPDHPCPECGSLLIRRPKSLRCWGCGAELDDEYNVTKQGDPEAEAEARAAKSAARAARAAAKAGAKKKTTAKRTAAKRSSAKRTTAKRTAAKRTTTKRKTAGPAKVVGATTAEEADIAADGPRLAAAEE